MIAALIGCHGAGKTTLGRKLSLLLGWPFDDETGARLATDRGHRPSGVTAADAQEAFDEAVFREELARDVAWDSGAHRIVETWHPGNLAYAMARSAPVALRHLDAVAASIARQPTVVILVTAPEGVLAQRKSEEGHLAFFLAVAAASSAWAERLGLPVIAEVDTRAHPAERLAADVARMVLAAMAREGGR